MSPLKIEPLHQRIGSGFPTLTKEVPTVEDWQGAGDDLRADPTGCLRFLTLNVNGFSPSDYISEFEALCDSLLRHRVDFACITEPKLDFSKGWLCAKMKESGKRMHHSTKITMTASRLVSPGNYKPGGVINAAFGKGCARQTSSYEDPSKLGRYIVTKMAGNGKAGLAIVSVYQICSGCVTGVRSTKRQQDIILKEDTGLTKDPRATLWLDLEKELAMLTATGFHLILMGDLNTSLYAKTRNLELLQLCETFNLVDPLIERDETAARTPTHKRGSTRIDYILVSNTIMPSITRFGVAPYDLIAPSDHRPVFCDLDMTKLFGSAETPASPSGRGVQSKNKIQCLNFIFRFDRIMQARGIHKRCKAALKEVEKNGPTPTASRLMQGADKDLRAALLAAEKKAGRYYKPPWSPKLQKAHVIERFWNLYTRNFGQQAGFSDKLQALAAAAGWPSCPSIDLADAREEFKEAKERLRKVRKNAEEERIKALEDSLSVACQNGEDKEAKKYRAIIRSEALKKSHAKLKMVTKGPLSGGLSAVEVVDENGTRSTVTDPSKMMTLLLEEGRRHFAQADGTPFTKKPLASMQYTACCFQANAILNGHASFKDSFDDDGKKITLDSDVKQFIEHAKFKKMPQDNGFVDCTLSAEDVKKGFMSWRESTTTSPAGDHLGIYRALGQDYSDEDIMEASKTLSYQPRKIEDIQREAWDSISTILQMGANFGLTIPRWEKAVCILIEKTPGNMLLHKLRRIFIMASDLNLALGELVGRRLVWHAEDSDLLHPDLWGSRPDRGAADASYCKEITLEAARVTYTPLAIMDNDAKSCYDRVVMVTAFLMMRRMGFPDITIEWIAKVHRRMKNHPKTAYGVAEEFFGTTDGHGVDKHGGGQGNRLMVAAWLLLSSFLFERMDELAHGIRFTDPTNELIHERKQDGVVDDVTQFFNKFEDDMRGCESTTVEMAEGIELDVQQWAKQLWITGGALEPSKCFWSILCWTTDASNRPCPMSKTDIEAEGAEVWVTNHDDNSKQKIELCDPSEARRTLGVFKSMTGNSRPQWEVTKDKSTVFAQQIRRANLSKEEGRMAAEGILLPKLGYSLATARFTEKEANSAHSPGLIACIQASGYAKSFARAIIHGPLKYGGASFGSLYAAQTWGQLDLTMHHLRRRGPTGILSRIVLSWTQLVSGLERPLLECTEQPIRYMKLNLILSLRMGLHKCGAKLRIFEAPVFPILRENDEHIMIVAIRYFEKSPKKLEDINICRMFLGAVTIADCVTPDGVSLTRAAYTVCKERSRASRLRWPKVPTPNDSQIGTWRNMWLNLLQKEGDEGNRRCARKGKHLLALLTPLGRWIRPPLSRQLFGTMVCGVRSYQLEEGVYRNILSGHTYTPDDMPVDAYPSEVEQEEENCSRNNSYKRREARRKAAPIVNLSKLRYIPVKKGTQPLGITSLAGIPEWQQDLIKAAYLVDGCTWETVRQRNKLLCVTDGGAKDLRGSYGGIVTDEFGKPLIRMSGTVPGYKPKSFRAEAFGMLVGAIICAQLQKENSELNIEFWCDNQSLIKVMSKHKEKRTCALHRNSSEYDVIITLRDVLCHSIDRSNFAWVESHQDDTVKHEDLTIPAIVNIMADAQASSALVIAPVLPIVDILPPAQALLDIEGKTITRYGRRAIFDAMYAQPMKSSVLRSHKWDERTFDLIDWNGLEIAMLSFSHAKRTSMVKLCNKQLPVGAIMRHRDSVTETGECPFCHEKETQEHLFSCQHNTGRNKIRERLVKNLDSCGVAPDVRTCVVATMFNDPRQTLKFDDIVKVGADALWRGKIPSSIGVLQEKYMRRMHPSRKTAPACHWSGRIALAALSAAFEIWLERNAEKNGENDNRKSEIQKNALLKRLANLQQGVATLTNAEDRDHFLPSFEAGLNMPMESMKSYVQWGNLTLKKMLKAQAKIDNRPDPEPDPNPPNQLANISLNENPAPHTDDTFHFPPLPSKNGPRANGSLLHST